MEEQKSKRKIDAAQPSTLSSYLRDARVLQAIAQIVFIIILVAVLAFLWNNILTSLTDKDLVPNFSFLSNRSGIPITETPDWYSVDSAYGQAFIVGIINTFRVVSVGLVGATLLGVLFGIFLLSNNWLIRTIARTYVEILRNTPLLVQLVFWFAILITLPEDALSFPQEGIMVVPYRFPIYLILLLTIWIFSRREADPRILTAALVSVVLMEVVFVVFGFGVGSAGLVTIIGLIVVLVAVFLPERTRNVLQAGAIIPVVQFVAHGFLYIFFEMKMISDPVAHIGEAFPAIILNNRGLVISELLATLRFSDWAAFVGVGFALAIIIWMYAGHVTETTGRPIPRGKYGFFAVIGFAILGLVIVSAEPPPSEYPLPVDGGQVQLVDVDEARAEGLLTLEDERQLQPAPLIVALPEKPRFRYEVGIVVSPEYLALLLGLIVYTSAVIAEIVRAGIQAVPYGQIEAARALGLSGSQTMSQIILPQALRVIIPPLTNQYLNLSKNSSLATAVGFADTYQVGTTIMNQSGQSITGFSMLLLVYLSMSLIISLFMNILNSRFKLVTR